MVPIANYNGPAGFQPQVKPFNYSAPYDNYSMPPTGSAPVSLDGNMQPMPIGAINPSIMSPGYQPMMGPGMNPLLSQPYVVVG